MTTSLFSLETLAIYLDIKLVQSAFLCLSDILWGLHVVMNPSNLAPGYFKVLSKRKCLAPERLDKGQDMSARIQLYPYCILGNMQGHISFLPGEVDMLPEQTHPICAHAHLYMF